MVRVEVRAVVEGGTECGSDKSIFVSDVDSLPTMSLTSGLVMFGMRFCRRFCKSAFVDDSKLSMRRLGDFNSADLQYELFLCWMGLLAVSAASIIITCRNKIDKLVCNNIL